MWELCGFAHSAQNASVDPTVKTAKCTGCMVEGSCQRACCIVIIHAAHDSVLTLGPSPAPAGNLAIILLVDKLWRYLNRFDYHST